MNNEILFLFGWLTDSVLWIVEHWEVFVGVLLFLAMVATAVIYLRSTGRQVIHKSNAANIDALESLLEAREKTIAVRDHYIVELKAKIEQHVAEHETTKADLEALRSEYKIVSAIVMSDLISWETNRLAILAKLDQAESDVRIYQARCVTLEKRLAERPA